MQKKAMKYVTGAMVGMAVGTAMAAAMNSKASAGLNLKKNVGKLTKSVSGIADSVKMLMK